MKVRRTVFLCFSWKRAVAVFPGKILEGQCRLSVNTETRQNFLIRALAKYKNTNLFKFKTNSESIFACVAIDPN